MFDRIKKDFEAAIEKIKWFSSLFSERIRIEIEVFKLLYKVEDLRKRRDELLKKIGEEVYEMRGKGRNVYADKEVADALKELESLEPEIRETIEKASEISKITA